MDDFEKYLAGQMKDSEFKNEWDDLAPEYDAINAIIVARKNSRLTQKELAERTGINQADISKIENGNANPSLKMLKRLAAGMGTALKLQFVPLETACATL